MEFNRIYNRQEFVNFLQNSFLPEDFMSSTTPVEFRTKMKYTTQAIKLGSSDTLDLVVYEVKHNSKNDARISLSKEAFRMLADEMEDRALVIFVPEDNNDNYRFSLIEITLEVKDDSARITRNYSNPRRCSYFLGKGIAYYTPNKYLNEKGRVVNAEDLRSRFSVEVLTKEFYQELSDWYAWAIKIIRFPNDLNDKTDDDKFNNESAIRLITRLIFVWFLKQRHLVPDEFFDEKYIADNLIASFNPHAKVDLFYKSDESKYYKAILQNLFFAMLNSPITPEGSKELSERHFRKGRGDYDNNKLMRYEYYFKNPQLFVDLANKTVPFLNGGLFDCLDEKDKDLYYDGFSDREAVKKALIVPDYLFFGEEVGKNIDLSEWYGDKKKKKVSARGIIDILKRYNFTVEENTPFDKEVSLDPELLGKVFENLLASYNPETQTTARKQTGSFYTPREIVQYMVDESLVAHLKRTVGDDLETQYRQLMQYTDEVVNFTEEQRKQIMQSLYNCKVLDPACGSGAFPMGMLQQMVHILSRIDPDNTQWKEMMLNKAIDETSDAYRTASSDERREIIADIERSFDESVNRPDYARKLYLIENCIYGVDIQPIAIQISKLRFFISLVVDQKSNDNPVENFGIRPLPNLEAKFVAANTLIGLDKKDASLFDSAEIKAKESELKIAKHKIFGAKTVRTKRKYRQIVNDLRLKIANMLEDCGAVGNAEAQQLAAWDMFNQNASSPYFDPEWMFNVKEGFDIVIGNPPYISAIDLKKSLGNTNYKYLKSLFQTSKGTVDMYVYFFEKGLNLLCDGGTLSFITPNKYLSANYGKTLRAYLMTNAKITTVLDVSRDSVFDADTYPVVSIIRKSSDTKTYEFIAIDKYKIEHKFNSSQLSELPENNWGFILSTKYKLTKKILLKSKSILDVCKINATSTASEADEFHNSLYNDEKIGLKLINTGTIDPYCNFWGARTLTDKGEQYLYPMLPNNAKILGINRYNLYNSPKIIIAKMSLRLEGFFDEKGEYASINTNCLHSIKVSPLKLMGWIHSKLFNYIYECYFEGLRMSGNYLPFTAPYLSCMCVPVNINFLEIDNLVSSIFNAKRLAVDTDITALEQQIDLLIYHLYNLTYDEVLIVDPQTSITREQYES
ncbi:Eco57I restriction-modification methylase [Parabacteroides distasonis]|uniref:Eco57I restriction-modification methylase domain-containing protein n=1 Tax=Parabacteroides distasonis TaxID=823 RepID=UPI001BA95B7A|nr:N-6 DNA methylase [Parabacteroides distasonis]QUT53513.1 Eco57I restriction-modification methylase [Parabacteroides distasonis]